MIEELIPIAKNIKIMAFDVDGVMTDGSVTFDENGVEYKTFNVRDGQGLKLLHKAGIIPAIITKRNNGTIRHRAKVLGISELHEGIQNKAEALKEICDKYSIKPEQISYMGDDLPDVCVQKIVGLPSCPHDAVDEVQQNCKFISTKNGGRGAVRELIEFVLKAQGFDLIELLYK